MNTRSFARLFVGSAVAGVLFCAAGADEATEPPKELDSAVAAANAEEGIKAPEDVAEAPADAIVEESGLKSKILKAGTGKHKPGPNGRVKVHYTGWTKDGKMFDSSVAEIVRLDGVIPGWTEGLQLMGEGEKRRFWIPADMAYGENPEGGRPAGMLCFDVELIENLLKPPEDVAAVPDDAEKTDSGLATRKLEEGTGKKKPRATSIITVDYSGWTTDGKLFDSSANRPPATFRLNEAMPGWTEGVQLMVRGEKRRFWIPEDLTYGPNPPEGAPEGMLVFDVELLHFTD